MKQHREKHCKQPPEAEPAPQLAALDHGLGFDHGRRLTGSPIRACGCRVAKR